MKEFIVRKLLPLLPKVRRVLDIQELRLYFYLSKYLEVYGIEKSNYDLNIFDVGANVGNTVSFFVDVVPNACVYAFEPISDTFNSLTNRFQGNKRVRCFRTALGSSIEEKVKIYLKKQSSWNSLANNETWINNTNSFEYISINTIDEFCNNNIIDKIDLLKIDTEGYELEVLKGAYNMLFENKIKAILIEVGSVRDNLQHTYYRDVVDFLDELGFTLIGFNETTNFVRLKDRVGILSFNAFFIKEPEFDVRETTET